MFGPTNGPAQNPSSGSLPPDLLRGLTSPRMSRRDVLRLGGISAVGLALAACGSISTGAQGSHPSGSAVADAAKAYWAKQTDTHALNYSNGVLYIDVNPNEKSDHPSIDLFTKQTGIKVNYQEIEQSNQSTFAMVQPLLAAGQYCGYDLIEIGSGIYLNKLIQLGFLQPLDHSRMTNFDKYASPLVKNPTYDPGNVYSMAWQSGMTGLAYNPKLTGRPITSWQDLMDPAFKGKIGMLADIEDLPNSALCATGVTPATSTQKDWANAAAWLTKLRDAGQIRKYYEQDYITALSNGDVWISMAWSGDIFSANNSGATLEFVIPTEGCPIWTDTMAIPKGAVNPVSAMKWMDFVYQPAIAAWIAESINYITPVPDAAEQITSDAAKLSGSARTSMEALAASPLVFPKPADDARLHSYRVLSNADLKAWTAMFEPIYQA